MSGWPAAGWPGPVASRRAAGRGQRRGPAPGRRPRPARCRHRPGQAVPGRPRRRQLPPFPADQVHQRVEAAHARGATVPAHSSPLPGARAAVTAGVDALEHGFRLDADLARVMAAAGDAPGGDPDGAGVLGQRRGDPAGPLRLGRGRAGWPSGPRRPMRRSDAGPWGGGVARRAGPTSAAAGCGHQLPWEVETRWSPPGWSPMTPWPGPPSTAGGCGRARRRRPGRRGPADFLLVHGDPLSDPGSRWRG